MKSSHYCASRGRPTPINFERRALRRRTACCIRCFLSKEELETLALQVKLAGRMMLQRDKGKVVFADLQDMSGKIQIFVRADALGSEAFDAFKHSDIGDIFGVSGQLFKTNTGELSIKVSALELITKSLRPLPEKFHGLADQELKYRQRYVDLIMNQDSKRVFAIRSQAVQFIRNYMIEAGFIEVETPMMQVIPGGAAAKPFRHASQRARHGVIPAHRARTLSQAAGRRRYRTGVSKSIAIFATRVCRPGIIRNSPCWSFTRPTPITKTSWT